MEFEIEGSVLVRYYDTNFCYDDIIDEIYAIE